MSIAQILFNLYFAFIGAYLSVVLASLLMQNGRVLERIRAIFKILIFLTLLYNISCVSRPTTSSKPREISPSITQEIVPKEIRPVRIAVPFKGLTPSQKFTYLSYYLPDALRGELGILGIPVVAREKELSHLLKEQVFTTEMGREDIKTVSFASAKLIIIGTFEQTENNLLLQIEVYDTESGISKGITRVSGKIKDMRFLIKQAALDVAALLGVRLTPQKEIQFWAEFPECKKAEVKKARKCFQKRARMNKKDIAKFYYKMPIQVKISLSNPNPRPGDSLEIDIETDRPCFPYIFTVFCKNQVGRIFPDNITPLSSPVRYFHYPSEEARMAGCSFQVVPDESCPTPYRFQEKIVAICVENRNNKLEKLTKVFMFENLQQHNFSTLATSLSRLTNYLAHLPQGTWGWGEASYTYCMED